MVKTSFRILLTALICCWAVAGVRADQSEAARKQFREIKAKADKGDAEAQLAVGAMYSSGIGTSIDLPKAAKYHRKAAEQGLAQGQYQLALDYAKGEGVKEDKPEALEWCLKAANQGLVEAQIAAGLGYLNGDGAKIHGAEALRWFRKASEQGSAQADYQIGKCFMEGAGVTKDISEGVKCMQRAAAAGYPGAQYYLAGLYAKGTGVEKDYEESYKWLALAAAQDDVLGPEIRIGMAKLETVLTKEQIADAQKNAREFIAAREAAEKTAVPPVPVNTTNASPPSPDAAFVMVNAQDEEAEIFADGKFFGNSPARLKLKEGSHVIEVKKTGCKPYQREINVTTGSDLNLRVRLEKE